MVVNEKVTVVEITARTEKTTYTITLDGCDPRVWPYSRTGRTYRPVRLEVVKRDGNLSKVELSGPQIKKDGTDGTQWALEHLWRDSEWPAWLTSIIGGLA